jgi:hypothetical protein
MSRGEQELLPAGKKKSKGGQVNFAQEKEEGTGQFQIGRLFQGESLLMSNPGLKHLG